MDTPPFHPEWLVRFWLETPGLNRLEPHLTLMIVAVCIAGFIFYKRNKAPSFREDFGEEQFQQLLTVQKMVEEQLRELEEDKSRKSLPDGEYVQKKRELEDLLQRTKKELRQFIS